MAEGWARHLKSESIEAYSAGVEKHGMNELAVRVMAEAGVDISGHTSKLVDELPVKEFDYVVTVCDKAHESCPFFPGKKVIHKSFDDPASFKGNVEDTLIKFRKTRDEIKNWIIEYFS